MTVAVFLLHRVAPRSNDAWELCLEPAEFEAFVEALVASGTLTDLASALDDEARDPGRLRCVLTFDDGYAELLHHAMPVLRRLEAPATVFLPTRYVEDGAPFWWDVLLWLGGRPDRLRRMQALWSWDRSASSDAATIDAWCGRFKRLPPERRDPMIEAIGAPTHISGAMCRAALKDLPNTVRLEPHGHTHTVLSALGESQAAREIRASCARIAAWTGRPPRFFAYPNGQPADFAAAHIEALRECGLTHALTTVPEMVHDRSDAYALPRLSVKPGAALQQLEEILNS